MDVVYLFLLHGLDDVADESVDDGQSRFVLAEFGALHELPQRLLYIHQVDAVVRRRIQQRRYDRIEMEPVLGGGGSDALLHRIQTHAPAFQFQFPPVDDELRERGHLFDQRYAFVGVELPLLAEGEQQLQAGDQLHQRRLNGEAEDAVDQLANVL